VTRPTGARPVDFGSCGAAAGVVLLYIKNQIFNSDDREVQMAQLPGLGQLADQDRGDVEKGRRAFLAAGYSPSFVIVKDLDAVAAADMQLGRAARANDLDSIPAGYLARTGAEAQFAQDTRARTICPT